MPLYAFWLLTSGRCASPLFYFKDTKPEGDRKRGEREKKRNNPKWSSGLTGIVFS